MCDFIGKILIQIEQNDFYYNCVFALRVLKVSQRKRLFFLKKKIIFRYLHKRTSSNKGGFIVVLILMLSAATAFRGFPLQYRSCCLFKALK